MLSWQVSWKGFVRLILDWSHSAVWRSMFVRQENNNIWPMLLSRLMWRYVCCIQFVEFFSSLSLSFSLLSYVLLSLAFVDWRIGWRPEHSSCRCTDETNAFGQWLANHYIWSWCYSSSSRGGIQPLNCCCMMLHHPHITNVLKLYLILQVSLSFCRLLLLKTGQRLPNMLFW